ncbi:hypothetical protein, partial [Nitratifractor sp.]
PPGAPTFWLCTPSHRASTHLAHFLLHNLGLKSAASALDAEAVLIAAFQATIAQELRTAPSSSLIAKDDTFGATSGAFSFFNYLQLFVFVMQVVDVSGHTAAAYDQKKE